MDHGKATIMSKISLAGMIGKGEEVGNAHIIEIRESFNGSGDDAFGGASSWPTIWVEVNFQSGEEHRAIDFAKKLTALIRSEFPESASLEAATKES